MHVGMTADNRIHVRIQTDIKEELKVAARLKGLKPSTFIHHLVVEAIGQAKKRNPEAFSKPKGYRPGRVKADDGDGKGKRKAS